MVLRDRTGEVELVEGPPFGNGLGQAEFDAVVPGSAIEVIGRVVQESSTHGPPELVVDHLRVLGPALAEAPITEGSPLEDRLDWRFLDLRRRRVRLVFEVQTTAERAMREFWRRHDFIEIHSPKIRRDRNRSGRELFTIEYFGRKAYLAQSPQFHKQMAMAAGFDKVFEIGPVFRANPLITNRHDTEFTSVDVEMAWIDSHEDVMAFEEQWLHHVVAEVKDCHGPEIAQYLGIDIHVPELPFPRVTIAEAYEVLAGLGWAGEARPGDIDAEGEQLLAGHIARTFGHDFVFVTEYGEAVRPFYHMRTEAGSDRTKGFDLLWKGIEVTTGAQREHRYPQLVDQAGERGISLPKIQTYLDYFKYGCPPHGGFGLGLTRLLMCLLGHSDVREVTFLPRGPQRLSP